MGTTVRACHRQLASHLLDISCYRPDPAGRNRNDDPEDGGGAEGGFDAQEDKQKKRKAAPRNPRPKLTMATLQVGYFPCFELKRAV